MGSTCRDGSEGGYRDGRGGTDCLEGLVVEAEVAADGVVPSPLHLSQHSGSFDGFRYRHGLLAEVVVFEAPGRSLVAGGGRRGEFGRVGSQDADGLVVEAEVAADGFVPPPVHLGEFGRSVGSFGDRNGF